MNTRTLRFVTAALLTAVSVTACAGGNQGATGEGAAQTQSSEAPATQASEAAAPSVDTPAATLTRDLTGMLVDHEYLAGAAVLTAVQAGGNLEDPTFKAAAGALDNNSVALSEAIASVYGPQAGEQFLSLWRNHIGFFVDYTLGRATNNEAMTTQASQKLDGYRADFGAFIEGATEGALPQSAVAEALLPHVNATKEAIDLVVAGDGEAFNQLREAAGHMPMIATTLSGAIVQQFPDKFSS